MVTVHYVATEPVGISVYTCESYGGTYSDHIIGGDNGNHRKDTSLVPISMGQINKCISYVPALGMCTFVKFRSRQTFATILFQPYLCGTHERSPMPSPYMHGQ
jgi:hypothetical protein